MIPRDTSPKAYAAQLEAYRRMTPDESIQIAMELSDTVRGLALDRLRKAHPDWSDRQLYLQLVREIYPELELPDAESSI
jgi:hypothetical protein